MSVDELRNRYNQHGIAEGRFAAGCDAPGTYGPDPAEVKNALGGESMEAPEQVLMLALQCVPLPSTGLQTARI
jgi:hypothetical protein